MEGKDAIVVFVCRVKIRMKKCLHRTSNMLVYNKIAFTILTHGGYLDKSPKSHKKISGTTRDRSYYNYFR